MTKEEVIKEADRFYPSSKTCSCCGCVKSDLKLSEREYVCSDCGFVIDRDLNASLNLKSLESSDNSRGEVVNPLRLNFDFKGNFVEAITNVA